MTTNGLSSRPAQIGQDYSLVQWLLKEACDSAL